MGLLQSFINVYFKTHLVVVDVRINPRLSTPALAGRLSCSRSLCKYRIWNLCPGCSVNTAACSVCGSDSKYLYSYRVWERPSIVLCVWTHVTSVSFTKALCLRDLVPSLKFCLFPVKIYLWEIASSFSKNPSLWLSPMWKWTTTRFQCAHVAFLTVLEWLPCNSQHSRLLGHSVYHGMLLKAIPLCLETHHCVISFSLWSSWGVKGRQAWHANIGWRWLWFAIFWGTIII